MEYMDQLIDNLARELAKPTSGHSRRGVIRLIGAAMFGGVLAAWKPASLKAQTCSPPCTGNKICCTSGSSPFCIPAGHTCCGNTGCNGSQQCCGTAASKFCAKATETCCGNKACAANETCCGNRNCCKRNQFCVEGRCQASNG